MTQRAAVTRRTPVTQRTSVAPGGPAGGHSGHPCAPPGGTYRSPLLELPGAVVASGLDEGVALHYGDPVAEQCHAVGGVGLVDGSHWRFLEIAGEERKSWLDRLVAQRLSDLPPYRCREALVLDSNGYVENHMFATELGGRVWVSAAPGPAGALLDHLRSRRAPGIDVHDVTGEWALLALVGPEVDRILTRIGAPKPVVMWSVVSLSGGGWLWWLPYPGLDAAYMTVPRPLLTRIVARLVSLGVRPIGVLAYEALRAESRLPRLGKDTDDHTYPQEVGWTGVAASLDKGDYPGRAAVERLERAGPPRRLVLLRLDIPAARRPVQGTPVALGGRPVGFVGTAAPHYRLGEVALALVAREVPDDADLSVDGMPAAVVSAGERVPS